MSGASFGTRTPTWRPAACRSLAPIALEAHRGPLSLLRLQAVSELQSVQCCFDAVTGSAVLPEASEQTHCFCAALPLHPARLCFLESGKLATRLTVERVALGSSCAIWSGARNPQRQPLLTGWIMSEVTSFPTGQACVLPSPGGGGGTGHW